MANYYLSIFFVLISIFTTTSVVNTLEQQRLDGQVINIAGRQRMLIQKFTKEVFLQQILVSNNQKPFEKTAQLFSLSLRALSRGGDTFADLGMTKSISLAPTNDQAVLMSLTKVNAMWQTQQTLLIGILTQTAISDEELRDLNKKSDQLVGAMNKAVGLLAKNSQNKVEALINEAMLMLLGTIIFGVLLSYFIIISVTKPLRELVGIAETFDSGDLSYVVPEELRQGNNEISALARATEAMRTRLENLLRSFQLSSLEMRNTAQQVSLISKGIIRAR